MENPVELETFESYVARLQQLETMGHTLITEINHENSVQSFSLPMHLDIWEEDKELN